MTRESDDRDSRPDPATWRSDVLDGMSEDERRAEIAALHARAQDDALRRRGRPLEDGDISAQKGTLPTITRIVSRRPVRDESPAREGDR
jgi:hypothetical protein